MSQDVVTEFDILMHELRAIPRTEFTIDRVEKLVSSLRGKRVYVRKRDFEWPHRLRMASHLLQNGIARSEAAQTLAVTLEVSESTAYRILQCALNEVRPAMRAPRQEDLFR
jgi:hypothetical protein